MHSLAFLLLKRRLQIQLLIIGITCFHELVVLVSDVGRVETSLGPMVKLLVHLFLLSNVDVVLAESVDVAEKEHILALDALVGVSVDLLALAERRPHMLDVLLHRLPHIRLLLVQISLANLVRVGLFEHVDAMQALDSLLELLVVVQVIVEHLVHLVLKLLLFIILLLDFLNRLLHLLLHALALESHIPHDQTQVFVDDEEVL